MNTKKEKNTFAEVILTILSLFILFSCSKMDDYRDYVPEGEFSYPGKIDSVKIHPGHNRLMLTGLLISDPKITQVKVYWESKKDSIIQNITRSAGVDTVRILIDNLNENSWNFELRTLDQQGNMSVPVNISGKVYGLKYLASLSNRLIKNAFITDSGAVVSWYEAGYLQGFNASEIIYLDSNHNERHLYTPKSDSISILKDYCPGTDFKYRCLYKPDVLSIDTFYTSFAIHEKLLNITGYLKNALSPIEYDTYDGQRWGTPAGWIVNEAIKNANNYGGFEMRNGTGYLSMEAGWGLPAVENGKIYQSVTLPQGSYSFKIESLINGASGTKYIVAALGDTLPDFSNVESEALTFADVDDTEISFTINETTTVTLGFACDLPGNGEYCKIGAVSLWAQP